MKRTKLVFVMFIAALFVLFSCSEDSTGPDNVKPGKPSNPNPENNATDISLTTIISWECTDPENDPLTYDVYFGISSNPSLLSSGQNSTNYDLGTLNEDTTYYWIIIAYDDHSNFTTSDIWEFTTIGGVTGTVTDIDGNEYQTLVIGDYEWMVENLKVTHFRNGDAIPHITGYANWTITPSAYCVYNNNPSNAYTYGNLYNWYAVDDSRNIAPVGWHVPTDEEIQELEMYLGMSTNQANSMGSGYRGTNEGSKLAGRADLWSDGPLENDPEFSTSGFSFLPGGYRSYYSGGYDSISSYGYFWSSTEYDSFGALSRRLNKNYSGVSRNYNYKACGYSVRCIRD